MLRIPMNVIMELLHQASEVEITVFETEENEAEGEDDATDGEDLADDPSYRELEKTIAGMSADELHQLLTLVQLGTEETESSNWDEAEAEARAIPEADRVGELLQALVLTDAVETALTQLGYEFEEEEEEEEQEEEDDENEDKNEA